MFKKEYVEVTSGGNKIGIHAFSIGAVSVKTKFRETSSKGLKAKLDLMADSQFTPWMPIWVWVIKHPEGTFLIDTGIGAQINDPNYLQPLGPFTRWLNKKLFRFSITEDQEINRQLLNANITPQSIDKIIITHLHIDHTNGLHHFPGTNILINKHEWEHPYGDLPQLYPPWFKPTLLHLDQTYKGFKASYLTKSKDLIVVHTPGHSYGHMSVLLKTDESHILFAGDVCYHQDQIRNDKYPGANVSYKQARKTYTLIKSFAKENKLVFLPSHDGVAGLRLSNLSTLY